MKTKSKNYLGGAALLTVGLLFTKFIGMFFKLPLTATIGDYGMGLYGYPYTIYSTFLTISTSGLPVAVSKMVSESVSKNNYKQAYKIFYIAFIALAVLGGLASVVMFAGANMFIKAFSWDPNTYYSIVALSFAPFFVALISVVRGFFQGLQIMQFTSISQILEQIGRVGVGLALAVFLTKTRGVEYGAAGATFGAVAGAVIAFVFLYIAYIVYRNKNSEVVALQPAEIPVQSTRRLLKTLLLIAIPVTIGGVVTTIMDLINSATISSCLQTAGYTLKEATTLYGRLSQKAQTLVNVPLVLGTALATSLVPAISESLALGKKAAARTRATMALKICMLISIPAAVGLSTLAEPIIKLLYPSAPEGYELLAGLSYVTIFTIGMSTTQGILQGAGRFYRPIKNILIGAAIKYVMNIMLVSDPVYGIYGAVISTICASAAIFLLNYYDVKRFVGLENIVPCLLKTLLASTAMGLFCHYFYGWLSAMISYKITVLLTIVLAVIIYAGIILLTRAFTKDDFRAVRG